MGHILYCYALDTWLYQGPNAGIGIVLINQPGINLDIGVRSSFLRWEDRYDQQGARNMAMTTAGVHLHLYPAHWNGRGSDLNGNFWLHMPFEATRVLMELGPRLTIEILRAATQIR